jgi:hypothetical protein
MKYLTKFNEATQAEHLKAIDEISNYVDNCFIDLKDIITILVNRFIKEHVRV